MPDSTLYNRSMRTTLIRFALTTAAALSFLLASCAGKYERIMSYEHYRAVGEVKPFVCVGRLPANECEEPPPGNDGHRDRSAGYLVYFGSAHFSNPDDPQAETIESLWDGFAPELALNEGGDPPVAPSRDEAIRRYGEPGLLRYLAARDNVPIRTIDPTKQEEVDYLLKLYSPAQLKVFFALRTVAQDAMRDPSVRESSPDAGAERVLKFYDRFSGLSGFSPTTASELDEACTRVIPQLERWRTITIDYFDPAQETPLAITNQIARTSSVYRDRYMVDVLEREVRKGKRVLTTVGLSHLVMQEPELRHRLSGDFGKMREDRPDPYVYRRPEFETLFSRFRPPPSANDSPFFRLPSPPTLSESRREHLTHELRKYRSRTGAPTATEDDFIGLGRTLAYLDRYEDAQLVFTRGLNAFPTSHKLLRHRGHRHITLRRFDLAFADLSRAASLIEDRSIPDEIEPDGAPNARNIPRSTSHTNIYYHLGLVHYLRGDFDHAARVFRKCRQWSTNDDMLVATINWLYASLRRAGRADEAAAVLDPIRPEMDIIENTSYHTLCLLYKGLVTPDSLPNPTNAVADLSLAYGVANWHYFNDKPDEGANGWAAMCAFYKGHNAFAVIAAEADLSRYFHKKPAKRNTTPR